MRVLVILYEGFTEYEYQIPVLALHFFAVPFDTVGLDTTNITGMMGLRASLELTLSEIDPARYSALLLPGIDRSKRDQIAKNMSLLTLIRDFDQAQKLIAMGISSLGWVRGFFTSQHCSWKHCWEKCRQWAGICKSW